MTQKVNSKGKPKGKRYFSGFSLVYSTAMSATAGLLTNYQVVALSTKRVRGKTEIIRTHVTMTATYHESNTAATDTVSGTKSKPPF